MCVHFCSVDCLHNKSFGAEQTVKNGDGRNFLDKRWIDKYTLEEKDVK